MKRPAGVTLAAIVLGLAAALLLLFAATSVLSVVLFHNKGMAAAAYPADAAGNPIAGPGLGFLLAIMLAMAAFYLALAAWAITTLVGLLRLRNWARYSAMVIGGCLVGLGLVCILGIVMVVTVMPTLTTPTNLPPHTMQAIFLFEGLIFALFSAVGVWWLIYFNRRDVKAVFAPRALQDYPGLAYDMQLQPAPPPLPGYRAPARGRFSPVPVPVIVIACLSFLGALSTVACALLPFPAFFLGATIGGAAGHLLFLVLALVAAALGLGLLRLDNRARIAFFALLALGAVNVILMPTAWYRGRMNVYMADIYARMHIPDFLPMTAFYTGPMMLFSAIFGLAIYAVIAWILYHYRNDFTTAPAYANNED